MRDYTKNNIPITFVIIICSVTFFLTKTKPKPVKPYCIVTNTTETPPPRKMRLQYRVNKTAQLTAGQRRHNTRSWDGYKENELD